MDVTIRAATVDDAEAIARVDLETHITAYRPLLGDDYLANVTPEENEDRWRKLISNHPSIEHPPQEVLIVERDGIIVAYSAIGPSRDDDGVGAGEVYTIYVHPSSWRGGVGTTLLGAATDRLRELGYAEVTLWVMEINQRARNFYEAQGWQPDGATEPARGRPLINLRYRAPHAP
jgi:ribosomal protein S18 acetylase RimI-like enzyme